MDQEVKPTPMSWEAKKEFYLGMAEELMLYPDEQADMLVINDLLIIAKKDSFTRKPVLNVYSVSDYIKRLEFVREGYLAQFSIKHKHTHIDIEGARLLSAFPVKHGLLFKEDERKVNG